jgi:myosin heavy subunit
MLVKNKDEVSAEIIELMSCSSLELAVTLFTEEPEDLGATRSKKKLKTIGGKFKAQLQSLMTMLHETSPHFIRCVKPNSKQTFQMWEAPLCLRQLKYAGLFEAIRIRKAGYAFRIPHQTFFRRYAIVVPGLERNRPEDIGDACKMLLQKLPKPLAPEEWVVGKTKVFLKSNAGRTAVEKMLNKAVLQYVVKLQQFFRNSLEMVRANREIFARRKEQQERERKLALERKKREEEEAAARLKKEEEERRIREEADRVENELREEEERRRKARRIKIDSAIAIQKVARGKSARNTYNRVLMIKALKSAMRTGDERKLENAIKEALRVSGDTAEGDYSVQLLDQVKDAQVLRERLTQQRMLKAQLKRAVDNEDLPLLKRALQALQVTFPEFSQTMPEAVEARSKLSELKAKDAARQRLQDLCNLDMSMVVDNGDELEEAIAKAEDLGLALNPKQVRLLKKATDLFNSAKPKLTVRDKIREAVEVADLQRIEEAQAEMKEMMTEANSTFCLPEMRAAKMMLKMFMFERQLNATSNKPMKPNAMDLCKQIYDSRGDGGRKEIQRKLWEEVRRNNACSALEPLISHRAAYTLICVTLRLPSHILLTYCCPPLLAFQCDKSKELMEVALRHYKWVRIFATWKYRQSGEDAQTNLAGTIRDTNMPMSARANLDRTMRDDSSPKGKGTFGRAPRKTLQGQGFGEGGKQDLGATARRMQGTGQKDLSATLRQYPQHKMERGIPRQPKVRSILLHSESHNAAAGSHNSFLSFRRQRSDPNDWRSLASCSMRGSSRVRRG